jgi:hypothetical protein
MNIFGSVFKTVFDVATLPLSAAADIVTMGGVVNDRRETYTGTKLKALERDLENIGNDLEDL